jgi:hypothetical protein
VTPPGGFVAVFLARLTRTQQQAFLSLARQMIAADSVASLGEMATLQQLRREMGVDVDGATEVLSLAAAAARFDTRAARIIALLELTVLSHSDRQSSLGENSMLQRLAGLWGFDATTVASIDAWVVRFRKLTDDALDMIAGSLNAG